MKIQYRVYKACHLFLSQMNPVHAFPAYFQQFPYHPIYNEVVCTSLYRSEHSTPDQIPGPRLLTTSPFTVAVVSLSPDLQAGEPPTSAVPSVPAGLMSIHGDTHLRITGMRRLYAENS